MTAIAWPGDTAIALGNDDSMRGLSRGDSWFADLEGASIVPIDDGGPAWPILATLEIGGRADLAILATDPRRRHPRDVAPSVVAAHRGGRLVAGRLPGGAHATPDRATSARGGPRIRLGRPPGTLGRVRGVGCRSGW
ncbi:MAG: hypothetical protein HY262_13165 [Chloroflexi bacterium]|nr:hypothetical protein [Chloroflexota bacterium]